MFTESQNNVKYSDNIWEDIKERLYLFITEEQSLYNILSLGKKDYFQLGNSKHIVFTRHDSNTVKIYSDFPIFEDSNQYDFTIHLRNSSDLEHILDAIFSVRVMDILVEE